jgi:hypothetical protein
VVRDAELGRRLADKLVKVWRRDGEEVWVLIHIEVQGQVEAKAFGIGVAQLTNLSGQSMGCG